MTDHPDTKRVTLKENLARITESIQQKDAESAARLIKGLRTDSLRRLVSALDPELLKKLVELLEPEVGAGLVERLAEPQALELMEDLSPESAADIIEELPVDVAGDLLREMDQEDSDDILEKMEDSADSDELRERVAYEWDSAGGLMSDRAVSFRENERVKDVLLRLSENAEDYSDHDVQYVYVVDHQEMLVGVLPLRSLVLTAPNLPISRVMIGKPVSVRVDATLKELQEIFDSAPYLGLPVIDEEGRLEGIVSREAVQEAMADQVTDDYLKAAGIVGGDELRSMPLRLRSIRRLTWLVPNIVLNLIAASVIAMFEDTLQAVIALAVFLPIVSDMSGCSGNQAVAVSVRELTLNIIRPKDYLQIVMKEGLLGMINGSVLGLLLGSVAGIWQGNLFLGLVIGLALALNTCLSVLLGGLVPLFLRGMKVDPALASGPLLTTCTDMCGFFLVLGTASMVLPYLV